MKCAPDKLVGKSIEWKGVHHSEHGDFTDISNHTVTYETESTCYEKRARKRVKSALGSCHAAFQSKKTRR